MLIAFAVLIFNLPRDSLCCLPLLQCDLIGIVGRRVQVFTVGCFLVAELVVGRKGVVKVIQRYLRVLVVGSCRAAGQPS